MMSQEISRTHR